MLKRFVNVLFILSLLIVFGTVAGMVVHDIYNPIDTFSFFEFVVLTIISVVPLMIVLVLKHIIYGSIK